jgi:nucleoside diphosphate kinase
MIQQTLVILKPDTILRGISGKIIDRLETRGLKLV